MTESCASFRPLDGESFSKLLGKVEIKDIPDSLPGFRPLDGESFSKLCICKRKRICNKVSVP